MRRCKLNLRGLSILSILTAVASAHAEGDWMRHFRIGGSVGLNFKTEFNTAGTFPVTSGPPGSRGGISYDDGFVGVDETGNAPLPNETAPATTFWGYNSAGQYDPTAETLTFRQTTSFTANGRQEADDFPPGLDMVYGGTFRQWDRVAIGGELGFGLSVFGARDRNPMAATIRQRTDRYSTAGTQIPTAPYSGPEAGRGTSAPVIYSTPTSLGETSGPGTITGSRSLEGMFYNFRLGPLIRWEFLPHWTLNGSAGGAFGIIDAEYKFNETISANANSSVNNRGNFDDTEMKFGAYGGAVVMYDTGNFWEMYLGAHVMSLQDAKFSEGGREAKMQLGAAVFITAGINWTF